MVGAGDSLASARRSVADSAERFAKLPALDSIVRYVVAGYAVSGSVISAVRRQKQPSK
jgi:hypothetical protein